MRERIESFLEEYERAQYRSLAGLSDAPDLVSIYDRHDDLLDPDVFHAVGSADPRADDRAEVVRAYRREFLAIGIEGSRNREREDAVLAIEATASVAIDGTTVGYRRLPVEIRNEPDRDRRAALERARLEVISQRLDPIHAESVRESHAVAGELLGTDYDAYCSALSGIDHDALEAKTSALLDETRDMHEELLRHYVRRGLPGVSREGLENHDLARLLYGEEHRAHFPSGGLVETIAGPVRAMGLDLEAGGRIEIDLEDREGKTPRAFCAAVRVPDEVHLVLRPYGGYDDYLVLLHELGHALHFAHVDPSLPIEFRRLGDNGVTEGYAIGFDHLLGRTVFLARVLDIDDPGPVVRFLAFRDLVMVRRYAAKLGYERMLHRRGSGPELASEYATRLTEATGARAPEALYLEDVDPSFYCVRYLRAWMLAATLHRTLRERFDEDWFLNPRTGPFLKDLWALGQTLPAEALARERLDVDELDFDPLLEMIREPF